MRLTINFNKAFLNLDGSENKDPLRDEPITLGKILAGQMANSNQGDPLKLSIWAMSMYKGESIPMDKSDIDALRTFIKSSQNLTNLMKFQMLEIIDDAEKIEKNSLKSAEA